MSRTLIYFPSANQIAHGMIDEQHVEVLQENATACEVKLSAKDDAFWAKKSHTKSPGTVFVLKEKAEKVLPPAVVASPVKSAKANKKKK